MRYEHYEIKLSKSDIQKLEAGMATLRKEIFWKELHGELDLQYQKIRTMLAIFDNVVWHQVQNADAR